MTGHSERITSVSLSQDEYYAVTSSADRTVRLWCLRMQICIAIYRGHTKTVWDVNFSPSGYYFLSGGADGLVILWKTDEPHAQRAFFHEGDVYKVSFGRDPSFVVSAG
jgi:transcription initiation factor TFIID subunit 5